MSEKDEYLGNDKLLQGTEGLGSSDASEIDQTGVDLAEASEDVAVAR